jgi:hypothetical protein
MGRELTGPRDSQEKPQAQPIAAKFLGFFPVSLDLLSAGLRLHFPFLSLFRFF